MPKLLVVTGALGLQGRAVVDHFLKNEPSYKIRGLTRKPTSEAAIALSKEGVEIVQADLDDIKSLKIAFKGANAIYAYTSFVDIIQSPEVTEKMQSGKETWIGKAAYDVEVHQGRNIADAAAGVPELERLVWSSLVDVAKLSNGKYTHAYHFDSKAHILDYMLSLEGLKDKVNGLVLGCFADNPSRLKQFWGFTKQSDGTYIQSLPIGADVPMAWIDVVGDNGAFVSALLKGPASTNVVGASEYLSANQWLELWSAHTGIPTGFKRSSAEEYANNDPVGLMQELFESFQFMEEYGSGGGNPSVWSPDEFEAKTDIKIPRTKIADHIKGFDWSSMLTDE